MGQVFYRDWTPGSFQDPTYQVQGAIPELEGMVPYIPKALPFQPQTYVDNRLSAPSFYLAHVQETGYTEADEFTEMPISDLAYRFAPEQPIRADVFNQLSQRWGSPTVSGSAPTHGIYTGLSDAGYE